MTAKHKCKIFYCFCGKCPPIISKKEEGFLYKEGITPGRELDALVAEYIFGIEIPEEADIQYLDTCMDLPHYSTSIEAAWEVVEKLEKQGFFFVIGKGHMGSFVASKDKVWASFGRWGEEIKHYEADTAPHAISLAALKAVGVKVK